MEEQASRSVAYKGTMSRVDAMLAHTSKSNACYNITEIF